MRMFIRRQLPAFAAIALILTAMTGPAVAQTSNGGDVFVVGTVTGVFPESKSLYVTMSGGREVMIVAGTTVTTMVETGAAASFSDVRLFDRVWVRGKVIDSNNLTADAIMIIPGLEPSGQLNP